MPPTRRRYRNEALNDFADKLPSERFGVIFDVGANIGQSTTEFVEVYPEARVFAFEPIAASFAELLEASRDLPNVVCNQLAIGPRPSSGVMKSVGTSTGNKIITGRPPGPDQEDVQIVRGDDFCAAHDIEHIDFLKVDTEGFDLDVLCGFQKMLATEDIDVLQVEAGVYAGSPRHVPLRRFTGYLEPMGYHLFGIYGAARDFRRLPVLARCDLVFISDAVVQR